jgi:hypothetical protein
MQYMIWWWLCSIWWTLELTSRLIGALIGKIIPASKFHYYTKTHSYTGNKCIRKHSFTHAHLHAHRHSLMHKRFTHTHVFMRALTYAHSCTHFQRHPHITSTYVIKSHAQTHKQRHYTHSQTQKHAHIHSRTHESIPAHSHTYNHTHAQTHMHTHLRSYVYTSTHIREHTHWTSNLTHSLNFKPDTNIHAHILRHFCMLTTCE